MAVHNQPSTALPSRPAIPPGLYPRAYHRPGLLDWLEQPRAGYGLRFADDNGGWDFWDYPRLASAVASAAEDIRQLRARPDGVVSIVIRTGPEFIAAFFGALDRRAAAEAADDLLRRHSAITELTASSCLAWSGTCSPAFMRRTSPVPRRSMRNGCPTSSWRLSRT